MIVPEHHMNVPIDVPITRNNEEYPNAPSGFQTENSPRSPSHNISCGTPLCSPQSQTVKTVQTVRMKVVIVGAGLSGLGTALALRRYVEPVYDGKLEIKIYEQHDAHDVGTHGFNDHSDLRMKNQGAAISLQGNALRVLNNFDPRLAHKVSSSGFPCRGFTWKTAGNHLLGREYLDLLPISRPLLIQCLQDALPKRSVTFKTVSRISTSEDKKPKVYFDDNTSEEADLIVGADGIRSVVRTSLFGDNDVFRPQYLGHCAVGGIIDLPLPDEYFQNPTIMFIHGSVGFFGYCSLSQNEPSKILYFSIFDSDLPRRGVELDHATITKELRERHRGWSDPVVGECLEKATLDNIYPIFYVPDLPHWGENGCVLVGDAAHSMPPASGQGGSQAFEDAQSLALLLAGYLDKYGPEEAIQQAIKGLYDMRHERVEGMKAKALQLKEPKRPWPFLTTMLVYSAVFVMVQVKYVMSFFSSANPVLEWDANDEVKKHLARCDGQ